MTPTPPARLSESVFRRFEPIIAAAVERFPNVVEVPTAKPNSTACQLRSAVKSYLTYKWTGKVDFEKFLLIYEDLTVREGEGKVVIGSAQLTRAFLEGKSEKSCSFSEPNLIEGDAIEVDMRIYNKTCATFVAQLSSLRALNKPIKFLYIKQELVDELQLNYDVVLEKVGENEWIMT